MASFLSNLFGGRGSSDAPLGATRTVDLSGNKFSFAMPEDFSKDMPAENLVLHLDIYDLKKFDNPEYGNLIRRWWDVKEPGFFGKNLGIVMMDISVQRVPENTRKEIHSNEYVIDNRLDFLFLLDESLHQRYDALVEQTKGADPEFRYYIMDFATLMGDTLNSAYRDKVIDGKKWTAYSVGGPHSQMIVGYVLPLVKKLYIEVTFTYSPNHNVLPRYFFNTAYVKTNLIENSIRVEYEKANCLSAIVSSRAWLNTTNAQVMKSNKNELLVPLFGPDIYERLALQDQQVAELTKALAKLDDEAEKE